MTGILYIGNKLEKHGAAPTSVDTLPSLLQPEGFKFKTVSSIKIKSLRLIHMLWSVFKNIRYRELVLIDTYSTSNFWYAVLCGQVCWVFSVPYIFILHGGNLKNRFEKSSSRVLSIFRDAKVCVVPSLFLKDQLQNFSFNLKQIPNSINLPFYKFSQRRVLRPKFLWVRAFAKVYNPEMAILVLEKILKNYPHAELCMVGPEKDGSLREVQELVRKKNLNVTFKGKLDKKEWTELSENYDIFLNTTSVDNTPVSLLEAMALGIPIVSTNVGGIPYLIVDHLNGLLVEAGDVEAMAEAIENLLRNPELSEKLSINGRSFVEKHDWKQVKQFWLELLG